MGKYFSDKLALLLITHDFIKLMLLSTTFC